MLLIIQHNAAYYNSSKDYHTHGIINYTKSMFLQDLQLRDTAKYSWTQFFDFVFLKVSVINSNSTKHIKFRATRDYYCSLHMQEIQHRLHKLRASKTTF